MSTLNDRSQPIKGNNSSTNTGVGFRCYMGLGVSRYMVEWSLSTKPGLRYFIKLYRLSVPQYIVIESEVEAVSSIRGDDEVARQ